MQQNYVVFMYMYIYFFNFINSVILYYFFIQKRKSKQNKISKKNIDHD